MVIKSIVTALPVASNTGWGVAGRNITAELKKLAFSQDLNQVNNGIVLKQDFPVSFNVPVIQPVRGVDMLPMYPQLRSGHNVGYSFCEDNLLMAKYVSNLSPYFKVVCVGSTWAQNQLQNAIGKQSDVAVKVAIQGVDQSIFKPMEVAHKRPDLFTVFSGGKWEFRKGQDIVIRAMSVMMQRHEDVRLVAAWWNPWQESAHTMRQSTLIQFAKNGHGEDAEMQDTVSINGIPMHRVEFIKQTPHEEMAIVMNSCDAAIFPNRCEAGTNLPLMEAMSCGLPVTATDNHGHSDVIRHVLFPCKISTSEITVRRTNGIDAMDVARWYEPNLESVIASLEFLYQDWNSDKRWIRAHGEMNRKNMSKFTWEACATSILDSINV